MRIYIAAPFELREEALKIQALLEARNHYITSRWVRYPEFESEQAGALADLDDIDDADVVLLINPPEWGRQGTGGRHYECGYAKAKGKPLFILGSRSHVFHQLDGVKLIDNVAELGIGL